MPPYTHATFNADFRETPTDDNVNDSLIPGGRDVTEEIRKELLEHEVQCTSILQHSSYGWEFDFEFINNTFICVIQSYESGQWLLICEPRKSIWWRRFLKNDDQSTRRALLLIHEAISSNAMFSNFRWYSEKQFEEGESTGVASPL